MGLNSLQVTRLPGGITNRPDNDIWGGSMPYLDPTRFYQFFDDFFDFVPTAWTVTETAGGAAQATGAGAGGQLVLTNSAGDDEIDQVQKAAISFLPVTGKRFAMKCRFQLSDVTQSDFAIGIQTISADGTVLANALDGIFFLKADGAATIDLYSRQDNAAGSVNTTVATLENATVVELACFYDGNGRLYYAVNGTVTGYITMTSGLLPNAAAAPIISLKNGEAVAKTATIDYLLIAQER